MLFAGSTLPWRRNPPQAELPTPVRGPMPGRPAVFIDKDGTLIDSPPGRVEPGLLRLRSGAAAALAMLAERGFALLVATNESGLARGCYSRAEFARLQAALELLLRKEAGVTLLDFLVCPHAPGPDGRPSCLCRKPAPGLLVRAARQHGIDLSCSWMVGDGLDDVEAGRRARCGTVLLAGGEPAPGKLTPLRRPDMRCDSWADAARQILLAPARAQPAF